MKLAKKESLGGGTGELCGGVVRVGGEGAVLGSSGAIPLFGGGVADGGLDGVAGDDAGAGGVFCARERCNASSAMDSGVEPEGGGVGVGPPVGGGNGKGAGVGEGAGLGEGAGGRELVEPYS